MDISHITADVNYLMDALETNKENLKSIAYQIRAERAIRDGDPELLRKALMQLVVNKDGKIGKVDEITLPLKCVLIHQTEKGFVDPSLDYGIKDFKSLIKFRLIKSCEELKTGYIYYEKSSDVGLRNDSKYKKLMKRGDKEIEKRLLDVYGKVLDFARSNDGKTIEESSGQQNSHAARLASSRAAAERAPIRSH